MFTILDHDKIIEKGVGFIQLPDAVLKFQGNDCKKFLQGASSNDIKTLQNQKGIATCFLSPKGRLIAAVKLFDSEEGVWGITTRIEADQLIESLKTQLLFSETELVDLSDQYSWVSAIGKETNSFISEVFKLPSVLEPLSSFTVEYFQTNIKVIQDSGWNYPAFLLLIPKEKIETILSMIEQERKTYPIQKINSETLNLIRIESGIPLFGIDIDDKTIPLEANLDNYISYTKGCYTGQETISRIKHYGHVNKILTRIEIDTDRSIPPLSPIYLEEKEIGKVTSSTYSPKLKKQIALGTIKYDAAQKETEVLVQLSDQKVKGIVL